VAAAACILEAQIGLSAILTFTVIALFS